jgi:hypothetical protein
MAEIATIITATAGLVIAIGGLVLAMSKLGPFINAVNKMLADQHKRANEAKSKPAIQQPVAASAKPSAEEPIQDVSVPKKFRNVFRLVVLFSFIAIILQLVTPGPPTSATIVVCTVSMGSIILVVMAWLWMILFKSMFMIASSTMRAFIPRPPDSSDPKSSTHS